MNSSEGANGLSNEDAQRAICAGTYGGKTWSKEERQTACQQYGGTYGPYPINLLLVSGAALAIVLICLVTYRVYRNKMKKSIHKNKKESTSLG